MLATVNSISFPVCKLGRSSATVLMESTGRLVDQAALRSSSYMYFAVNKISYYLTSYFVSLAAPLVTCLAVCVANSKQVTKGNL